MYKHDMLLMTYNQTSTQSLNQMWGSKDFHRSNSVKFIIESNNISVYQLKSPSRYRVPILRYGLLNITYFDWLIVQLIQENGSQ